MSAHAIVFSVSMMPRIITDTQQENNVNKATLKCSSKRAAASDSVDTCNSVCSTPLRTGSETCTLRI